MQSVHKDDVDCKAFTVKKDGSIADTKVERSVNPYLDKEAMRVIAAMPKWKPGKQRGKQ